jgi:hypothetical protein
MLKAEEVDPEASSIEYKIEPASMALAAGLTAAGVLMTALMFLAPLYSAESQQHMMSQFEVGLQLGQIRQRQNVIKAEFEQLEALALQFEAMRTDKPAAKPALADVKK